LMVKEMDESKREQALGEIEALRTRLRNRVGSIIRVESLEEFNQRLESLQKLFTE